jgi:hypothetical protein
MLQNPVECTLNRKGQLGVKSLPASIELLTLPVTGQVTGKVIVSARLARPGLRGSIEAIRDMILGTKPNDPSYPISFEILETPSPKGLDQFLRRL